MDRKERARISKHDRFEDWGIDIYGRWRPFADTSTSFAAGQMRKHQRVIYRDMKLLAESKGGSDERK